MATIFLKIGLIATTVGQRQGRQLKYEDKRGYCFLRPQFQFL